MRQRWPVSQPRRRGQRRRQWHDGERRFSAVVRFPERFRNAPEAIERNRILNCWPRATIGMIIMPTNCVNRTIEPNEISFWTTWPPPYQMIAPIATLARLLLKLS